MQKNSILQILLILIVLSTSQSYNADISQIFQRYSIMTHCSKQQITQWTCRLCKKTQKLQNIQYIQNNLTSIMSYAGFSSSLDKILVIFRGTTDAQNWVEDFTYKQVKYQKCSFYLSYLSIADQIYQAIDRIKAFHADKKIIVLGSSLGGALANIAALQIQFKYKLVSQLHTFGGPRIGNLQTSTYAKIKIPSIWRVVHNRDIVPHLPLLSQNYKHSSTQVFFDEIMSKYKLCNQSGEDTTCSDGFYPNFSITDHVTYWTKLNVSDIC